MDRTDISIIREKVDMAVTLLAEGDIAACFSLCDDIEKELKIKPLEMKVRESVLSRVELIRREMNRRMVKNIRDKNTLERNI